MLFNENKSKTSEPPYYVDVVLCSGESLAIELFDGNKQLVNGPATLTMLSHTTYTPMPLPLNLPPGHSMQQIVDENGVLKHIIIGSPSSNDQMAAKNQILSQNGSKLTPHHLNGTRFSSFKKKLSPTTGNRNELTYSKPNRFNGLTNDPLINSSTGLLNSSNLVYPVCCYCCPDCMPNNQVNSNSMNPFSNELSYDGPTNYSINQTSTAKSMTNNNYSRRTLANNSFSAKISRGDKPENSRPDNYRYDNSRKESINRNETYGINKNGIKGHKGTNKTILSNSNISNYSSATIASNQPKGALLGNKQVCKQCVSQEHYSNNYTNSSTYHSNSYNQKYLYPTPFARASSYQANNQSNHYQIASKSIQQQKYSYASDATKQSSNKNQRASKSNYHNFITQPSSQPPLLDARNNTATSSRDSKVYPSVLNQQESDSYSELIRYVNSNHISAFKSHKRIDLDTSKLNHPNNTQSTVMNKERSASNSATASSSPISEHYDFSSEDSEQIAYKHTTLLDYPTNYSPNYGYSYSSNNCSNGSSTNSSMNSSAATNNQPPRVHKKSIRNESQMNVKNSDECAIDNQKIEQSKIITNDDKDDGYEDDFELKNFDSKSNDEIIIENGEIIEKIEKIADQQAADKPSEDKLNDLVRETKENKLDQVDEMTKVRAEELIAQQIELCDVIECDSVVKSNTVAISYENEKFVDENSNEIDNIDRNSQTEKKPQIVEFTDFLQAKSEELSIIKDDSNVEMIEENVKSDR